MSARKTTTAQADLVLLPTLKNSLLNLPASLVAVLSNANTLAQNVIVELSWRQPAPQPQQQDARQAQKPASVSKSVYLGWTGMQSKTKLAPIVGGRDSVRGGGEREVPTVEVDATFGRLVGFGEGMKVGFTQRLCSWVDLVGLWRTSGSNIRRRMLADRSKCPQ